MLDLEDFGFQNWGRSLLFWRQEEAFTGSSPVTGTNKGLYFL